MNIDGVDCTEMSVVVSHDFVLFQIPALHRLVVTAREEVRVAGTDDETTYRAEKMKYLIRINFRADKFSRTCSARKLEIFARTYFRAPSDFEILKT